MTSSPVTSAPGRLASGSADPAGMAGHGPVAITARVAGRRPLAPGVMETTLSAPEIAAAAGPLQFVQVGLREHAGVHAAAGAAGRPFLGRPFSIYDADPESGRITLVYRVVGPGTAALAGLEPGATVDLLGPLGRPAPAVPPEPGAPLWLVAWGLQAVPLRLLAAHARRAGVPVAALLGAGGVAARVLDGQWSPLVPPPLVSPRRPQPGILEGLAIVPPGQLLPLLADALASAGAAGGPRPRLFAAGPHPFLRQVQELTERHPADAFLVVDAYMPCGYGACLACAVPVRDGAGTRYARACVEGRWFPAREVIL